MSSPLRRVLVACEFSGVVRQAFTDRGWFALSCDLLPSEKPGDHYQGDVRDLLSGSWDLMIAFPPCTYLCRSGIHWNKRIPGRAEKTEEALAFVRLLLDAPIPRIALENPIGLIGTHIRKADQIIQPYEYGHDASKATCLWLKGLPKLQPTQIISPRQVCGKNRWGNQSDAGHNLVPERKDRWKDRSRTYEGIAAAMADQWTNI